MSLYCRPETPEDEPFIRQLMIETLTVQLAASSWPDAVRDHLLDAQYKVRRQGFRVSAGACPGIVVFDGEMPVAWYVAAVSEDEIQLVNLAVRSDRRGRGIGSEVLRRLLDDADRSGKSVRLCVGMNNPRAGELYVRHGFRQTGTDGTHRFMERRAGRRAQ